MYVEISKQPWGGGGGALNYVDLGKLVGSFGFNGLLRQYFSLNRIKEREIEERNDRREKNVQTTPTAPTVSTVAPCLTLFQISKSPGTGSLPSTIAQPEQYIDCIYI